MSSEFNPHPVKDQSEGAAAYPHAARDDGTVYSAFKEPDASSPILKGSRVQIRLTSIQDPRHGKIGTVESKVSEKTWNVMDTDGNSHQVQTRSLLISPLKVLQPPSNGNVTPSCKLPDPGETATPNGCGALRPMRKIKVEVRVTGDAWTLRRQRLLELVRDTNLSMKYQRDRRVDFDNGVKHDHYFLRRTSARCLRAVATGGAAVLAECGAEDESPFTAATAAPRDNWKIEVDHTFECQLLAFSMLNAKSCVKTGGVLSNLDLAATRTRQPVVVRQFLDPIFVVHNDELALKNGEDCLNLRLLDEELNKMKGQAVKGWVKAANKGPNHEVDSLGRLLESAFDRSEAVTRGGDDLGHLVRSFERELKDLEDTYAQALEDATRGSIGAGSVADERAVVARAEELAAAVRATFAALDLS